MSPMENELFDKIHLLSSKVSIENWLLFADWGSNGSERQCSAEQRCEEHCRFEVVSQVYSRLKQE